MKQILLDEIKLTLELNEHGIDFNAEKIRLLRGENPVAVLSFNEPVRHPELEQLLSSN
ncbi:MAG TPA: hypothetical protein VHP36_01760 [Chitinispirillaceae bacterium]|nr:hypothetical protein [Chitinispirillaceae bacterium]